MILFPLDTPLQIQIRIQYPLLILQKVPSLLLSRLCVYGEAR